MPQDPMRKSPWISIEDTQLDEESVQAWSAREQDQEQQQKLEAALKRLPPLHQDLVELMRLDKSQEEIARMFGVTQPAISHRIRRLQRQLRWLLEAPEVPPTFDQDIERARPGVLHVIRTLLETTCQLESSRILGLNQSWIRHLYRHVCERLSLQGALESLAVLRHLDGNWAILHEAKLKQPLDQYRLYGSLLARLRAEREEREREGGGL